MNQITAPFIPENAPFSAPQRVWLNEMLGRMFAPKAQVAPAQALQVSVFFATQGGTAERLAKKMAKRLKESGHTATIASVETLTIDKLASTSNAIFFASTYGEGEPPETARAFRDSLLADGAARINGVRFAVFALGDRNYEQFCRFGIELDECLGALGGSRLHARCESDVDVDAAFDAWSAAALAALHHGPSATNEVNGVSPQLVMAESTHTRDKPFHAELLERRLLTHASSSKQTIHVSLALAGSSLRYEAGDACGLLAQNDPALVEEILATLPFSGSEIVALAKVGDCTVEDALLHHLQITRLTRKVVQAFAERAQCRTLQGVLAGSSGQLDAFVYGRGLIDMLHAYPGVLTQPNDLAELLPRLAPRLYSISSSPSAHLNELHCTIGVVRYEAHSRLRGGVASTMLADRIEVGSRVPIFIQPNQRFRLPASSSAPIIMIGPGTGIAPFRSFLHERRALGHTGRNWLFFGERSAQTDFLYCRELQEFVGDGHLTRLDTAFSRDQEQKVYVQDRMLESGAELFRWLQDGATVYVCGDASRMAKDVDAALHRVIETHGQVSSDAAQEYVAALHEENRYHRDVY